MKKYFLQRVVENNVIIESKYFGKLYNEDKFKKRSLRYTGL